MVVSDVATVGDVAGFLRGMGEYGLADRLDYLASDADLDVGEFPATDESARGFFELFSSVESEGEVVLGCSPEGWVVAEWRWFADARGVSVWFLDAGRVMFAATDKDGRFVDIQGPVRTLERTALMQGLVREELFFGVTINRRKKFAP